MYMYVSVDVTFRIGNKLREISSYLNPFYATSELYSFTYQFIVSVCSGLLPFETNYDI